jgi:uncharacterized membrane protein
MKTERVRKSVLRGLGFLLPPLLTFVILIWMWRTVQYYVLEPVTEGARQVLIWSLNDARADVGPTNPVGMDPTLVAGEEEIYKRLPSGEFVPLEVYATALRHAGETSGLNDSREVYRHYVDATYLRSQIATPLFIVLLLVLMYLLGSLLAAGLGAVLRSDFERAVERLPAVRAVYRALRSVTDFVLGDNQLDIKRVVAVEYPCQGVWCIGFVTGEGIAQVASTAHEPVLSVLVSTAPVPFKGYTIMVPMRVALELDLSVEEAALFLMSLGTRVPDRHVEAI